MPKHIFLLICWIPLSISPVFSQSACDELRDLILSNTSPQSVGLRQTTLSIWGKDTIRTQKEIDPRGLEHEYQWRDGYVQEKIVTELRTYHLSDRKQHYWGAPYNGWSYTEIDTTQTKGRFIHKRDSIQIKALIIYIYKQHTNCQKRGTEIINGQNCTIYTYEHHANPDTLKKYATTKGYENHILIPVTYHKTWIGNDGRIYQTEEWHDKGERYTASFSRTTIEYDVPVTINVPQNTYNFLELLKKEQRRDTIMKHFLVYSRRPLMKSQTGAPVLKKVDTKAQFQKSEADFKRCIEQQVSAHRIADRFYQKPTTVNLSFTVERDGTVSHIAVDKPKKRRQYVEAEAIRIIETTSGQWKAAVKNGQNACSVQKVAIDFPLFGTYSQRD
ncbi:MAG: hypothetical protein JNL70_15165 [Saprospiraceae bacterium]|nr:hypothetical protein [Saprospiraceae bacterium]